MCGFYDPSTNSYLRFIWAVFKLLSPFIFFCTPQTRESLPVWEAIVGNLMWFTEYSLCSGFPGGASGKEPTCQCRRLKRRGFYPWVRKISWRRARQPTPVFLPENFMDRGAWRAIVHGAARVRHDWSDLACRHAPCSPPGLSIQISFSSVQSFSHVRLFVIPGTASFLVHHQLPELAQTHVHPVGDAIQQSHPLSSPSPPAFNLLQQEYWSGLPCPPPEDLPDPGIEPISLMSPALAGRFFTTSATWEAHILGWLKQELVTTRMSVRMQRNSAMHALLVETQNGTATL